MRFVGIAALLLGCAMPAQAAVMYEIKGTADVWTDDFQGNFAHVGLFEFTGLGALDSPFSQDALWGPGGLSIQAVGGHYNMLSFDLKWADAPLAGFLDGKLHAVTGWADGGYGGPEGGISYSLTIKTARIYETPEFYGGPPEFVLGAPIPEPASWAMMIGGLGVVGVAMRRRKAVVSFA